jgi:uncharacterized protein (DUF342 family)
MYYRPLRPCICRGCTDKSSRLQFERRTRYKRPTAQEYAEYLQARVDKIERQLRHARREAKEQLRKKREKAEHIKKAEECKRAAEAKVKNESSYESATRPREQQEQDAQSRMAKNHVATEHFSTTETEVNLGRAYQRLLFSLLSLECSSFQAVQEQTYW